MEDFQLVPIQNVDAVAVFAGGGIDEILSNIEERVMSFVPDVETARGRKDIASIAYKVAQSKTYLDGLGKDLVSDWKNKAKVVDSERKKARDFLDDLKAKVRKPLDDYEAAEEARVRRHEEGISRMEDLTSTADPLGEFSSAYLKGRLLELEATEIGPHWEEYAAKAEATKERCISILTAAIARREQAEAEQAELLRLRQEAADRAAKDEAERIAKERAEREARIAAEAAERAKREAEEKARQKIEAAARREQELKEAAERAERERIEAEARATAEREAAVREAERRAAEEAERKEKERVAREAAEKAEAERKAANKRHRAKIEKEIIEDFKNIGFNDEESEAFMNALVLGQFRHITINY